MKYFLVGILVGIACAIPGWGITVFLKAFFPDLAKWAIVIFFPPFMLFRIILHFLDGMGARNWIPWLAIPISLIYYILLFGCFGILYSFNISLKQKIAAIGAIYIGQFILLMLVWGLVALTFGMG